MQAPKIAELRGMSDEELIERHDAMTAHVSVGVSYLVEELARRQADRQMTVVVRLTWVITVATIVNVILVVVSLAD